MVAPSWIHVDFISTSICILSYGKFIGVALCNITSLANHANPLHISLHIFSEGNITTVTLYAIAPSWSLPTPPLFFPTWLAELRPKSNNPSSSSHSMYPFTWTCFLNCCDYSRTHRRACKPGSKEGRQFPQIRNFYIHCYVYIKEEKN